MKIKADQNAGEAFASAFDAHHDEIFRHCYFHVFDRETAVDLAQETFMNVWLYLTKGNDIDNIRALLYRTAGNLCLNYKRKHKTVSLDQLLAEGFDVGEDDPKQTKDPIAEQQALRALAQIQENYRVAVTLRYIEGLEPAAIGEITKQSSNTVSAHITRGLKALRSFLKDE